MTTKTKMTGNHEYIAGPDLPTEPIPPGRYLVHNRARPKQKLGRNGFRAWIQTQSDNLIECNCNFGGCQNAGLHKHYRVKLP
jgi:hypothetical protein